jgi:hypothetical protein
MRDDSWAPYGAVAGAFGIALFLAGAIVIGDRPDFDAPSAEVAAFYDENRTRIQVSSALDAAAAPFLIWFLATVASLARAGGPGARRAGAAAYGLGVTYIGLFLADVTAQAVAALRPDCMAAAPEVAVALDDFSWLAMGMAAFLATGMLAAFAVLALRDKALWPGWLGLLAAIAAPAYALRTGILFTTDGAFAADGVLGLYVPVAALATSIVLASVALALRLRRAPG